MRFSGRVSSGRWPRMTRRSKQWYTKLSRLPNSFAKVSIGPPRCVCLDNKIIEQGTDGDPAMPSRERLPRTESLAESAPADAGGLSDHGGVSAGRTLRANQPTPPSELIDRGQLGGRMRTEWGHGVCPLLFHGDGIGQRAGISPFAGQRSEAAQARRSSGTGPAGHRVETYAHRANAKAES